METTGVDADERWLPRLMRFAALALVCGGAASHFGLLRVTHDVVARPKRPPATSTTTEPSRTYITDGIGFFSIDILSKFDRYLELIGKESGADVRILLVPNVPGNDLPAFALQRMRELGVGRHVNRRGLLIVYDLGSERMRIEVGDGLQGIFPDGFVGYLMREHASSFFAAGDPEVGLRTTLFMVSRRLREEALGEGFDRRALTFIEDGRRLASGAGATARAGTSVPATPFLGRPSTDAERARFTPAQTPASALALYEQWLREGHNQTDLPLFAPGSEQVLRSLPKTQAFNDYILYGEYGQQFTVTVRGDLAILVFTSTPLVAPHFFRRSAKGWHIDIDARIRDTQECIGFPLTWRMRNSGDDYSRAFADLYVAYRGGELMRVRGGDNRFLPIPIRSK